jgi:hypothetical protein
MDQKNRSCLLNIKKWEKFILLIKTNNGFGCRPRIYLNRNCSGGKIEQMMVTRIKNDYSNS